MFEYVLRRLIYMLITIFAVASILFIVFRMLPGEATLQVISPAMDEAVQARMKAAFGLDKPLWQQYFIYLKNLVTMEWGRSFVSAQRVTDILEYRFWNTILLMAAGMCMTLVLGISIGMIMAWKRNSAIDIAGTVTGMIFQAAPPFITGLLLLMVLSYRLGLFPTGGMYPAGQRPDGMLELLLMPAFWDRIVLPTITVGLYYITTPMLIMRDSMLEVLGSDFIELAKAKGLKPRVVMIKHAARNALLGVVTLASIMVGFAIGGQVVVEALFSWPGMGQLMVESAASHDYPVAQGTFLMLAILVISLNFLTDVWYCYLDPRIKISSSGLA
ncbi:MAG: ABC transporter permease [Acidiferrobacteraceae bacterium]|jgi:peptide/nickel transport system permease protein|nr:ABC transporter permease [Acidiferrobacteraceae bacterium]MDP6792054.1 ABC transporter permease [Arenicellales bacterium]MDP6919409.1 ABC transporter permease [Arenicellales bacterium]HCY14006.1 ABC transporter permease [Gammaproteobacteria bacterium]